MINPMSVKSLIQWIEEDFQCSIGPARAYIDLPISADQVIHEPYITLAIGVKNKTNAESILTTAFERLFYPLVRAPIVHTLFWRCDFKISVESEAVQEIGELLCTYEEERDGKHVPTYAVQSWDSRNWYEDAGKSILTSIYTRICIPALHWYPYKFKYIKAEGAPVSMIED